MIWALDGEVAGQAHAVVRPGDAAQVGAVLAACDAARVPVTAAAGRSGVCGASAPVHGGVVLDLTALTGIVAVDHESMVLDVRAGTFGTALEDELRASHGVTVGHWPQSMDLSTVGGWLACRGAGQYSTRYGKIEDIVVGLDAVLADGRTIRTGGAPEGRGRTRPHAAVRRQRRHARDHHRRTIEAAPRSRGGAARAPSASRRSPRDSTRAVGSCAVAPPRRCSASTTPRRANATSSRGPTTRSWCSTRVIPISWTR